MYGERRAIKKMGKLLHEQRLDGVDADLVGIVRETAASLPFDLLVVEGLRTLERQRELVKRKLSRTLRSKHLTGDAVDLCAVKNGNVLWEDREAYRLIRAAMLYNAKEAGIKVRQGSDWDMNNVADELEITAYVKKFGRKPLVDYPHWEKV